MALRLVAKRLLDPCKKSSSSVNLLRSAAASASTTRRWLSGGGHGHGEAVQDVPLGSVNDVIIHLTFVDPSGARRVVPGIIGTVQK